MLITYVVYTLVLVVPVCLIWMADKYTHIAFQLKLFAFMFLVVISSIRYGIGTDYFNYVDNFMLINLNSEYSTYKEVGFTLLNRCVFVLGLDVQFVFVLMSIFTIYFIAKSVPPIHASMYIFLYITVLYLMSYVLVRQAFAIALSGYIMRFANEKKPFKYFLWTLIGSSFHLSMLCFVPIYFLRKIEIKSWVLLCLFLLFVFITFKTDLIFFLFKNIFSLTPYSGYFLDMYFIAKPEIGSGFGLGVVFGIGFFIFIFRDRMVNRFPDLNFMINVSFLFFCMYLLSVQLVILGRLKDVFILYYILPIPYMISVLPIKQKYIPSLIIVIVFAALYYNNISVSDSSLGTGSGISPYKTIFDI